MQRERKRPPLRFALEWLLAQKSWIVPIPRTTKLSDWRRTRSGEPQLTREDLGEMESAASKITGKARAPPRI